ncbi:MAG TPA: transglutaminase domain-containing protein [Solirubrobacteraceae bacterium]|jgi:transglutaminase-like putative cysteine protease|nr:transglutaminase domain-containing protein [Solirubrobacteraceae bacterium]
MSAVARAADDSVSTRAATGSHRPAIASVPAAAQERPWIRVCSFAALGAYGLERWATLMRPAPGWRFAGLLALAVTLAGIVPVLARRDRVVAALVGFLGLLPAFPVSGLPWQSFIHLRVAVAAGAIGKGLAQLPNTLVPYAGQSHDVRLVILLGAAVLLLDAAGVLAFTGWTGSPLGDGRRAAAALPLTALAIVPSTLLRPQWPYVQGLVLFVLLAAFLWGERVRRHTGGSALVAVMLAGVAAAIAAPHIDQHSPWINYRAWAGTTVRRRLVAFDWNQTYGPLRWPHGGQEVLTVRAKTGDYWKAEDLDTFNGYGWVAGPGLSPALPAPSGSGLVEWTQSIDVTIRGMQTENVIAAGAAGKPSGLAGGVGEGTDAGTWVADGPLGPGARYRIRTYSPRPSPQKLATAGRRYPTKLLADYLTLTIPVGKPYEGQALPVRFPLFHTPQPPSASWPGAVADTTPVLASSPYARAYALARRLAARARTPYAFVAGVQWYLSHFAYNENPPLTRYPLETFLFSRREGYCQQFSGAMAMLLRMGGVPARVAAGFTSGTYDTSSHRWIVTDRDAHAWVEAWFPRYGWVRFDPTPVTAPARGGPAAPPIVKPVSTGPAQTSQAPRRDIGGQSTPANIARPSGSGGLDPWVMVLAALVAGAVAGALGWMLRVPRAREGLVDELERALTRTRRPLAGGATLVTLERHLRASPGAEAYVRTVRMARYGGGLRGPTAAERRALRRELARGLGPMGRLRAWRALPPRVRGPRT